MSLSSAGQLSGTPRAFGSFPLVRVVAGTSSLPMGTAPGGLPAKINSPAGLALLTSGSHVSLAVVDSYEHAVLRVDLP
jgi:hypothetical protein